MQVGFPQSRLQTICTVGIDNTAISLQVQPSSESNVTCMQCVCWSVLGTVILTADFLRLNLDKIELINV